MAARWLVIKSGAECRNSALASYRAARRTLASTLLSATAAADAQFGELCRKSVICRPHKLRKIILPPRIGLI